MLSFDSGAGLEQLIPLQNDTYIFTHRRAGIVPVDDALSDPKLVTRKNKTSSEEVNWSRGQPTASHIKPSFSELSPLSLLSEICLHYHARILF